MKANNLWYIAAFVHTINYKLLSKIHNNFIIWRLKNASVSDKPEKARVPLKIVRYLIILNMLSLSANYATASCDRGFLRNTPVEPELSLNRFVA